jgi:arylformamidase
VALYRGMERAALDAAYNNRAAVPRFAEISAERVQRSARVRGTRAGRYDLRYGDASRERLDFFPAASPHAPVLAFIHGGYWQSNDKEPSSFLADGPLAHGFAVALIEYTLAPQADIARIVAEVRCAIDWLAANAGPLGGDPARIYVSGHSAGGHLAASALDRPGVAGVLAISGLYDLEPIRLCYLNEKLGLSEESARRHSPLFHLPERSPPIVVAVGAAELPELVRQSAHYAAALAARGLPARYLPLPGHDHFTVLDALARPDGALCTALLGMKRA